jgi:hypothetical protein
MNELVLEKLITLEIVVETMLDTLVESNTIDRTKFDDAVIATLKKIKKQIDSEINENDLNHFFMGPKGEA